MGEAQSKIFLSELLRQNLKLFKNQGNKRGSGKEGKDPNENEEKGSNPNKQTQKVIAFSFPIFNFIGKYRYRFLGKCYLYISLSLSDRALHESKKAGGRSIRRFSFFC